MIRFIPTFSLVVLAVPGFAADLPPDKGNTIPESSQRPVVISAGRGAATPSLPAFDLPDGYELVVAAAEPMVTHPIMGCVDDRGRLFIGDGVGVNWNKAQLEANPPNRVLMLEDTDRDGNYDKSTIYADKMTFPQGACWLNGSLYVCSPPGLWKLTDTDKDGIADQREMIVSGFEYTGNAADVHGPKLHPNGRLYWCHGRKGHKVIGKDGTVVHEGLASGIWSCNPDGSEVQWHSLGCADNPTGLDFTPEGDVIGTCNLYYSNPRGDTLVHWLYGGVYERADQMKAIAGLPRTLEKMPVVHNFGHVAVSGCAFWNASGIPGTALQLFVTHFNTQRLVRTELIPDGATYRATENEFLKLHDADAHLTDVIADQDGSLLVVDTGGWFRIGCPSSIMAKPDVHGAVYRIKRKSASASQQVAIQVRGGLTNEVDALAALSSAHPPSRRRACEWFAHSGKANEEQKKALVRLLAEPLDRPLEHAALLACARVFRGAELVRQLGGTKDPLVLARTLRVADMSGVEGEVFERVVKDALSSHDAVLAGEAFLIIGRRPLMTPLAVEALTAQLSAITRMAVRPDSDPEAKGGVAVGAAASMQSRFALISKLEDVLPAMLADAGAQALITTMLTSPVAPIREAALTILANQTLGVANEAWLPPLEKMLAEANGAGAVAPLALDAIKKLKNNRFDPQLQTIVDNPKRPLTLRLRALAAMKGLKMTDATFTLLQSVLSDDSSSPAARIQSAAMLGGSSLTNEQMIALAPVLAKAGPVEMKELLALVRKVKDAAAARALATALARNPALISQQESIYRTAFSNQPPEVFETTVLPALRKAEAVIDAKKRQLGALAEKAATTGDAAAGRKHFEAGKGTCLACHKIGEIGRAIGPDLSKIGSIRSERDLLESIIFPNSTLARDYESHILETSEGQTIMGLIRSHTAEGLLVMDIAGQEKSLPHAQIVSNTTLTTSLMPMGLDGTMPEKELLDLVAYLRHLK